ncbi:Ldh family oxidoreductase [unidentified bacterial endosymbiont]|uniref:Ldh family oxidoreductase n=1 Tax=unidentified bacterial endosymbiont TaxID=2355 RepID=UPI0020A13C8E|nr:Ldh family oxidoreductase [unidentified bacterial endosymbiont]
MDTSYPQQDLEIPRDLLTQRISATLIRAGVKAQAAEATAEILIEGSARGYALHGVERLLHILEGLQRGTISPAAEATVVRETSAVAIIDARCGLGPPQGKRAMELAVQKAIHGGIGVVGVINGSHLGALAYYSEIASSQGCVGLTLSTSSPAVVVKGGQRKTFGTNPISYSIPQTPFPITADFATSKVSRGKICDYQQKGLSLPSGWAVDRQGVGTNDPSEALAGGLQTLDGDIKGSLISLLVSVLAGPLIGGVINPAVKGTRYMDSSPNKGDLFFAFHVETFTCPSLFIQEMGQLSSFITQQNVEFRIPGARHQRDSAQHKIKISPLLAQALEV